MSDKKPAHVPPEISDLHCYTETDGVITTTMFDVPGYRVVRVLGTVYGLTVRSRNIAASLGMVLKSMAGGELRWFTNMVSLYQPDPGRGRRKLRSNGMGLSNADMYPPFVFIALFGSERCHQPRSSGDQKSRRKRHHLPPLRVRGHGRVRAMLRLRHCGYH